MATLQPSSYWQGLIDKAEAELSSLRATKTTNCRSADDWDALCATRPGGRCDMAGENARAAVRSACTSQTAEVLDKETKLAELYKNLHDSQKAEGVQASKTPEQLAAEKAQSAKYFNQRIVLFGLFALAIIGVSIWLYRKYKK